MLLLGLWLALRPPPETGPTYHIPVGRWLFELVAFTLVACVGLLAVRRRRRWRRHVGTAVILIASLVAYQRTVQHLNGMTAKDRRTQQHAISQIKTLWGGRVVINSKSRRKEVGAVDLADTAIDDAGLVHVESFTGMYRLSLKNTRITDAGLKHLSGLTNLERLSLADANVTGAGLIHLKGLTLSSLDLSGCKITDAGLAQLKGLKITWLNLSRTQITDAGLAHLAGQPFDGLELDDTQITDAGLVHFQQMPNLQYLKLRSTYVTNAGLTHLKGLSTLRQLSLYGTQTTEPNDFTTAVPNCAINRLPPNE